ncbi:hypothetical protein HanPSC8_Chr06g0241461 [Helianthus annuus]|nr:hypothetical protein HanPSC8_Chr06g0241461 [Helianthus annuus]
MSAVCKEKRVCFFFYYKTTFHTSTLLSALSLYNLSPTFFSTLNPSPTIDPKVRAPSSTPKSTTVHLICSVIRPLSLRHLTLSSHDSSTMSHLRSNSRSRRIRTYSFIIAAAAILRRVGDSGRFGVAPPPPISLSLSTGSGGGGGGWDVVVEVVAGMWWWRWWKKRSAKKRFQEDMESYQCGEEVSQTFFNERSARKQTSCGL